MMNCFKKYSYKHMNSSGNPAACKTANFGIG